MRLLLAAEPFVGQVPIEGSKSPNHRPLPRRPDELIKDCERPVAAEAADNGASLPQRASAWCRDDRLPAGNAVLRCQQARATHVFIDGSGSRVSGVCRFRSPRRRSGCQWPDSDGMHLRVRLITVHLAGSGPRNLAAPCQSLCSESEVVDHG